MISTRKLLRNSCFKYQIYNFSMLFNMFWGLIYNLIKKVFYGMHAANYFGTHDTRSFTSLFYKTIVQDGDNQIYLWVLTFHIKFKYNEIHSFKVYKSAVFSIFMYKFLCGHVFLTIYWKVELLGQMAIVCLTFWGMPNCFLKQLHCFILT